MIGTNKPDAVESVEAMLADMQDGRLLEPEQPDPALVEALIEQRQHTYFSYDDWQYLDDQEVARGTAVGRPRLKFTSIEDMIAAKNR